MQRSFPLSNSGLGLWLLSLAALIAAGGWWWATRLPAPDPAVPTAQWVDESSCQGCHAVQYQAWQGSHHHLAMQPANERTVLADFGQASLASDSEISEFLRQKDGFWIRTPGPDGQPADYKVAYTFGVAPLQQYLLALPDGRLQAHGAAWDSENRRWFHLYDGMSVDHRHRLHWSKAQQNADFMCIECHSSGFRRDYDAERDRHNSRWQALGVGCQSCHGPASGHLRWALDRGAPRGDTGKGFEHALTAGGASEVEACARCHSRRTPLGNGYEHGNALLDDYLPVILTPDLYEVDGKIKGEVFEYGSFRQSRMHAAGVVCSDCHNPHSARLRMPGNAVCTQCHNPSATPTRPEIAAGGLQAKNYDHPDHHRHTVGSEGARCVGCHMPGKLYMVNDLRRDHSFSSPNPPQARALGHSDACLGCHRDDEADDVLVRFQQWYPDAQPRDGGYARDLHAARQGLPGAAQAVLRQLGRGDLPDIRRATLLSELPNYPSAAAQRALIQGLQDPSPLVRRTAVELLGELLSAPQQSAVLAAMANDPVRAVRLAASWHLLQLRPEAGTDPQARRQLIAEYEQLQNTMLDRAEAHHNLAGVYQLTGREEQVEPALRRALRQDPDFFPAVILLAQWRERVAQDVDGALRLLEETIQRHPEEASLRHALGLTLVRQGAREQALRALRRAHELAPEQPEYGYVLAVALHDSGQAPAALDLLRTLSRRHPANRPLRQALIGYLRAGGHHEEAQAALAELAAQNPDDPLLRHGR